MVVIFDTLELNPLSLNTIWEQSDSDRKTLSRKATVKIFNNEEEYNEYINENKNS